MILLYPVFSLVLIVKLLFYFLRIKYEEELVRSETRLQELSLEKENCLKECQDIRVQLQLTEDKSDNLNTQYNDTLRKLKESEFILNVHILKKVYNCTF